MTMTLFQLPPSPNNVKVQVALRIKGIDFETVDVEFSGDRSAVVEATGQPLTPAIKHGSVCLFGSGAILRYIDANFRDQGPRLFAESREQMYAIEEWEKWANGEFKWVIIHIAQQMFSGQDDPEATKKSHDLLATLAPKIEEALQDQEFLTGANPNAADATLYGWAKYVAVDLETAPENHPSRFFGQKIQLPESYKKMHAWLKRMAAF